MPINSSQLRLIVDPTPQAVAQRAADWIVEQANLNIEQHGTFRIALAGGSTPKAAYNLLAEAQTDWSKWQIFYGDERCLAPDHHDRNSLMAQESWLNKIPLIAEQHHPIPAELGPLEGALLYHQELPVTLDLVLLGMGPDGHTASLFPGQEAAWNSSQAERAVPVFDAPKPPPERISLSLDYIRSARQRAVIVTGEDKWDACRQWFEARPLPIQQTTSSGSVVFADQAAINDP